MTRRDLLQSLALAATGPGLSATAVSPLPGTKPLTWQDDLSEMMMDGAHRFVQRKIAESVAQRKQFWRRDFSSREAYEKSVEPNRKYFRHIIGAVDERVPVVMERFGDEHNPALVAETNGYTVHQVFWPVLERVRGEGLLLAPKTSSRGYVIALPDADQTPEQVVGLAPGIATESQFARSLAESGFTVVVPVLIDRTSRWSGNPNIRMTEQTHREWIYRQAFHMGRHIIGYEVQKALSAVDWCKSQSNDAPIGVAGYGEGGLIAFYAAALDTRIDTVLVSGYFDSRQNVWSEPIYRNVWALLTQFGDAELATLIAPRGLIVEYAAVPKETNQKGDLKTPAFKTVAAEFDRIDSLLAPNFMKKHLVRSGAEQPAAGFGSDKAIGLFAKLLAAHNAVPVSAALPHDNRRTFSPGERQKRQVKELENHTQWLVRESEHVRESWFLYKVMPELADETWSMKLRHPTLPPAKFIDGARWYRRYFRQEVLGQFQEPLLPPNPRTRQIYDKPKWTGYDVVLDVWPELFAWGILLLPKDIKPGERRPVVICQHGRRGIPSEVVEGNTDYYHDFAARLAEQGFITFAPHNLYRGEDRYRWLSRKGNSVKASLFSFIISQHEQILRWLGSLPMVDAERIGFYGLSYGGETAVRVPTVLEGYKLSICSGDFNSWTRKVAATDERFSFMYSIEWEMPYFNMGSTFDYAEMAYLMIPRPFMVERGHHDQVGRDQWVAYEYAKVRWLYAQLGLSSETEIEYFNGGHTINGEETFRFLHKHLNWA
jgi:dienelactone hydrolase